MLQAPHFGMQGNKKQQIMSKKKVVIDDVVAHLKLQKFTVSSDL